MSDREPKTPRREKRVRRVRKPVRIEAPVFPDVMPPWPAEARAALYRMAVAAYERRKASGNCETEPD